MKLDVSWLPRPLRAALLPLGGHGLAATAAVLLALLVVAAQMPPLFRAIVTPMSGNAAPADGGQDARLQKWSDSLAASLAQIEGRSMFVLPAPPPPPPAPRRVLDDTPPAPAAPLTYAGPAIVAIAANSVWFDDGTRLSITTAEQSSGETDGSELAVLAIDGPWAATLRWRGVEFRVPLFDRTTERFMQPEPPAPAPAIEPPTPKEQNQ